MQKAVEKTRSWKVREEIGKNEVGKFGPKLVQLKLKKINQLEKNIEVGKIN